MFGFKLPQFMSGMEGSAMSKMSDAQKLQALGSAFSGDQQGLAELLGGIGGGPVKNVDGQDISAAFGGMLNDPGMGASFSPALRLARKFGFGKGR